MHTSLSKANKISDKSINNTSNSVQIEKNNFQRLSRTSNIIPKMNRKLIFHFIYHELENMSRLEWINFHRSTPWGPLGIFETHSLGWKSYFTKITFRQESIPLHSKQPQSQPLTRKGFTEALKVFNSQATTRKGTAHCILLSQVKLGHLRCSVRSRIVKKI